MQGMQKTQVQSPGVGQGNPFQYSCLENSTDRGAWWATVHGVTESDTTEWLTTHTHTHTHTHTQRFWAADGVGLCNPWKNENKLYEPFRQPSFLPVGNLRAMGSEKEFKQSPVAFLRWGNGDQCSWRLTWMGVARQTHGQKRKQMKQKSDSLKKINKIDKS